MDVTLSLVYLPSAIALGALHALEPGHAKTLTAAYLIGTKGTKRDAIALGLSVAFTHSIVVVLLAALAIWIGKETFTDQAMYWLQVASGGVVVLLGGWMLSRRIRQLRKHGAPAAPAAPAALIATAAPAHDHHHHQDHDHHHDHPHDHDHHHPDHDHPHDHDHDHSHPHSDDHDHADLSDDEHARAHAATLPDYAKRGERPTLGQIIAFGAAGGMIPCPASVTVMLLALSVSQAGIGLLLVCGFSLGLAITLVGIGLAVVAGLSRLSPTGRLAWVTRQAPIISATMVILSGLVALAIVAFGWDSAHAHGHAPEPPAPATAEPPSSPAAPATPLAPAQPEQSAVTSPTVPPNRQPALQLRLLTWNIQYGRSAGADTNNWPARRPLVLAELKTAQPDLFCAQEVLPEQLAELRAALPDYAVVAEGRDGPDAGEHCPVFFRKQRFDCAAQGTFWYNTATTQPGRDWGTQYNRICTWVELRDKPSGRSFRLWNTHFPLGPEHRRKAIDLLLQKIAAQPPLPTLVAGDFNEPQGPAAWPQLAQANLLDSYALAVKKTGFATLRWQNLETVRIDFVMVSAGWQVPEHKTIDAHRDGVHGSDHNAVWAQLEFIDGRR